jgi:hypothetical protein
MEAQEEHFDIMIHYRTVAGNVAFVEPWVTSFRPANSLVSHLQYQHNINTMGKMGNDTFDFGPTHLSVFKPSSGSFFFPLGSSRDRLGSSRD